MRPSRERVLQAEAAGRAETLAQIGGHSWGVVSDSGGERRCGEVGKILRPCGL